MDVWVLKVSIGLVLVLLSVVLVWHLVGYLASKRPRKARRQSPEPPSREPKRAPAAPEEGTTCPE
jgi:hypothetical protein